MNSDIDKSSGGHHKKIKLAESELLVNAIHQFFQSIRSYHADEFDREGKAADGLAGRVAAASRCIRLVALQRVSYCRGVDGFERRVKEEIGAAGIDAMVAGFYRRVRVDDLIGPMYPEDDWEGSEERLRLFLRFRLLGEPEYTLSRGHPRLRGRHMPFAIGEPERDRWLRLMAAAMDEAGVTGRAREDLDEFFFQVADFMRNR